ARDQAPAALDHQPTPRRLRARPFLRRPLRASAAVGDPSGHAGPAVSLLREDGGGLVELSARVSYGHETPRNQKGDGGATLTDTAGPKSLRSVSAAGE